MRQHKVTLLDLELEAEIDRIKADAAAVIGRCQGNLGDIDAIEREREAMIADARARYEAVKRGGR
jgi:hypothetical protein